MRRKKFDIYQSKVHLGITLIVVILPFLFLFFFSRITHIASSVLFEDVLVSSIRLLIAYIFAALFGWLLAISFYHGKRSTIALPVFDVLQSFPTFAILPLAAYIWGVSNITVIFFLIITIIWPILFSIISSLKLIKNDWEEATEILDLRGFAYLKYFLFPVSLPGLITGSIIGLGEGWEALVATEMIVGTRPGLGDFFQAYSHNPTITALGITGLLLIIFSVNKLIWLPLLRWGHDTMEE